MVVISTYNLTFPVETLLLLQPTINQVVIRLPNIIQDSQMGTEILFYKTTGGNQNINVASGSTNVILDTSQASLSYYTMTSTQSSVRFVACKWTTGAYAWAIV